MISITNQTCNAEIPEISQSLLQIRDVMLNELDGCFNNNHEETTTPIFAETEFPFNRLKAIFKPLTALMEGNCNENELKIIGNFFDNQRGYYTKKVCESTNQLDSFTNFNFVSSNTQSSKKRKHHGTRGY